MSVTEHIIVTICALWGGMAWIRCFHLQHQINRLEKRLNGRADGSQEIVKPHKSDLNPDLSGG